MSNIIDNRAAMLELFNSMPPEDRGRQLPFTSRQTEFALSEMFNRDQAEQMIGAAKAMGGPLWQNPVNASSALEAYEQACAKLAQFDASAKLGDAEAYANIRALIAERGEGAALVLRAVAEYWKPEHAERRDPGFWKRQGREFVEGMRQSVGLA